MFHTIAQDYLRYLKAGNLSDILSLFSKDAKVHSPIYGVKSAVDFFTELQNDTQASQLALDGVFTEKGSQRGIILFDYHWTIRDGRAVNFKVADVLVLDEHYKIKQLTIIYDTVVSRNLIQSLQS